MGKEAGAQFKVSIKEIGANQRVIRVFKNLGKISGNMSGDIF